MVKLHFRYPSKTCSASGHKIFLVLHARFLSGMVCAHRTGLLIGPMGYRVCVYFLLAHSAAKARRISDVEKEPQ